MISIIIPTFNRSSLISETLASIIAQTYSHWECLVVDDGSTDNSIKVINSFIEKDNRIRLYQRPASSVKGANVCRNIGLKEAIGDYIIFFDSDDLMTEDHLEKKVSATKETNADALIFRTSWFNAPDHFQNYDYGVFSRFKINADNFITKKIQWLTPDPIIRAEIAKKIYFTEKKGSAGEYGYFCKLTLICKNIEYCDEVVSLRRFHSESISLVENQQTLKSISNKNFYDYYDVFREILPYNPSKATQNYLFKKFNDILYKDSSIKINKLRYFKDVISHKGLIKGFSTFFRTFYFK